MRKDHTPRTMTASQLLLQQLAARDMMLKMIEDFKAKGYRLDEETGIWIGPNGEHMWLDG